MSMNQILSRPDSNIAATGRVAELLFNTSSSLLDYSFNYPYFHHTKEENEYILYAIIPYGSFDIEQVKKEVFMTADEAEDFLLDQVEIKPNQHLFKRVKPTDILV